MAEHEGFTPGPWRVEPMDQTIPMFGITAGTGDWWIGYGFENQADANLAADAPRLLAENARLREALREVHELLTYCESAAPASAVYASEVAQSALSAAGEDG